MQNRIALLLVTAGLAACGGGSGGGDDGGGTGSDPFGLDARVAPNLSIRLGAQPSSEYVLSWIDPRGIESAQTGPEDQNLNYSQLRLTVAEINDNRVEVALIPETLERTTFDFAAEGTRINLEVDAMAKQIATLVESYLSRREAKAGDAA